MLDTAVHLFNWLLLTVLIEVGNLTGYYLYPVELVLLLLISGAVALLVALLVQWSLTEPPEDEHTPYPKQ